MKQSKSKLHYQHITIPNLDAAPEQLDDTSESKTLPIEPNKKVIPIPSKQILPNDDYKDYLQKRQFQYSQSGSLIINSNNLRLLCIKQGLYQFPQLNSKLYLHFKCIEKIQNLNQYINVRTLYLQNNVIRKIQNLQCLPNLQNLFLQHNMIDKIDGLSQNKKLLVLNLSYNNIFTIEGLSELPHLQNFMITNNYLEKFQSLMHLGQCTNELTSLDLSGNRIGPDKRLFDLIPQIKCLYLGGNPLVRQIQHYRRTVVGRLKNLLYLDQRAVAQDERLLAQKWIQQGNEGLKKVKLQLQKKRQQRKLEQSKQIMKDINSHRAKKISIFKRTISQLQEQITKLKQYRQDPTNQDMIYYYNSNIEQKQAKIRQLQGFIQSNSCRIQGKQPPKRQQPQRRQSQQQNQLISLTIQQKQSLQLNIQSQQQPSSIKQQQQQSASQDLKSQSTLVQKQQQPKINKPYNIDQLD